MSPIQGTAAVSVVDAIVAAITSSIRGECDMQPWRITRVQHTCFVMDAGSGRVAVDPSLDYFGNLWSPKGQNDRAVTTLRGVDAVVVSHSHVDHFHVPTLLQLDRDTPIVLPEADLDARFPMSGELKEHGFTDIRFLGVDRPAAVAGFEISAVAACESIEGIPQQSLLFAAGGLRVLHGADTLEDFAGYARLAAQGPVDVALLPLNCSFNFRALRNQMSPATFLRSVELLSPVVAVPLGINEGTRRAQTALDAPWFPHSEALYTDRFLLSHAPAGTSVEPLADGQTLLLERAADGAVTWRSEPEPTGADLSAAGVEIAMGRFWSLALDVHRRDRHYFGLNLTRKFPQWRDSWLECRDRLEALLPEWAEHLTDALGRASRRYSTLPVLMHFPDTVDFLEARGDDVAALVMQSLYLLDPDVAEHDYLQRIYDVLSYRVRDDAEALWRCHFEYARWLQTRQAAKQPNRPADFSPAAEQGWLRRQIDADLDAADYAHPRINPIFGPFEGTPEFLRQGPSGEDTLTFYLVDRNDERIRTSVKIFSRTSAALVRAIEASRGRKTITAICAETGAGIDEFRRLYESMLAFTPYLMDTHWLPSETLAWEPHFTR
ncbi:MBL fold metallo-hydrolase [Paractinoplanes abujensis]|nr:MBL fold metallo-hydrolase [Actinoplanes abujensis]